MATTLPPAPINEPPGSFAWQQWYLQLQTILAGTSGTIAWVLVDKTGSNITDLASRNHNDLAAFQGGTGGERYHLTATQNSLLSSTQTANYVLAGPTSGSAAVATFRALVAADFSALTVTESNITLADVVTDDVSITKHGFVPKAPNDTAKFLRGDATWAAASAGNLTGPITSVGLATAIAAQTGTGSTFVVQNTPTLTTPVIGAATGISLSLSGTVSHANTGAAATAGQITLVAGTKTVNTTAATATALLFFQRVTSGGTIGFATTYTVNAGTSFTINSDSALDTSVYNWLIVETH